MLMLLGAVLDHDCDRVRAQGGLQAEAIGSALTAIQAAEKPKKEMSKWMKKELGIKLKNGKLSEKW